MAKCKDCLHYCACMMMYEKTWGERPKLGDGDGQCDTFADRSRYVVREKSEWILNHDGSGTCKKCRRTTIAVWDFDNWLNFCPHCGADMR